jgi:hypothetical protein
VKRVLIGTGVVALLLIAVSGVLLRRLSRRATLYPCIETSKTGWLTAVSEGVLVRVEWEEVRGKLSVTEEKNPVVWKDVGSAAARSTAMDVLRPTPSTGTSATGKISLYVSCDGSGTHWAGETTEAVPWETCVTPRHETRLDCLERAIASRRGVDRTAGALTERVLGLARANNVIPTPPPIIYRPGGVEIGHPGDDAW